MLHKPNDLLSAWWQNRYFQNHFKMNWSGFNLFQWFMSQEPPNWYTTASLAYLKSVLQNATSYLPKDTLMVTLPYLKYLSIVPKFSFKAANSKFLMLHIWFPSTFPNYSATFILPVPVLATQGSYYSQIVISCFLPSGILFPLFLSSIF